VPRSRPRWPAGRGSRLSLSRRERARGGREDHGERTAVQGRQGRDRAHPDRSDTVTVHYRGTLVDGTEFDSSFKRGQPATFPVSGVIPGWTEALQMMKEGAQWKIAVPPNLAYGDRGPLAGQVLVFDVELISTAPGAPAGQ